MKIFNFEKKINLNKMLYEEYVVVFFLSNPDLNSFNYFFSLTVL